MTGGMSYSEPARAVDGGTRLLAASSFSAVARTGITVYGCGPDEAAVFREMAPRFGVEPVIVEEAVADGNVELAYGNRCVSVGHKTRVANSTLLALSRVGVEYVSTRSVGCNHIDVKYAESVGLTVGTVSYSPDSVADYTVMLMLMAVRHVKSTIRRADVFDYRLGEVRGRELRDLTVGVVGTGRIGAAVVARLRGFGCRVLASDSRPRGGIDYVPIDELVRESDVVSLHTPLTVETFHLVDRERIAGMKRGAVIVNTGRGSLVDTRALLMALESGRLGGAALDVVEGEEGIFYADRRDRLTGNEPLARLQRMANVIVSPHSAYYTDHALSDTVENSLINCLNFEDGKRHG